MDQRIRRIDRFMCRHSLARHAVRSRQNDLLDEILDVPSVFDKLHRQMVEQSWMARRFAHGAEVVDRRHDTLTEQMVPRAIDEHPGRERVRGVDKASRQFEAAASPREVHFLGTAERLDESPSGR